MEKTPRIAQVKALPGKHLEITFTNGVVKDYDCGPLLRSRLEFHLLRSEAFFGAVRVDAGGYGVSWSDSLDLSEYELWTNGIEVRGSAAA